MATLNHLAILTVLLSFQLASALKASEFFTICKRNDPDLNACIEKSLNDMRPLMKKGISQLKFASVEPMIIPKIKVFQGTGPVSIDSTFFNTHIDGISSYDIRSVNADLDKYTISFEAFLPYMYVSGDYKIDGRILVLPIAGHGDSWSNYTEVTGIATVKGHPVERDGQTFMEVDDFKFDMNVKKAVIHMNDLFNGNKELGDAMNKFMSDNWEVVFGELKPVVDEAVGVLLKDATEKIFNKFPLDELFPK